MPEVTTPIMTDATGRLIAAAIASSAIIPPEVTVADDGDVTQELLANTIYHFTGALTSLTVTLGAVTTGVTAIYHFDFNCGSTAPTVTLPNTVILPDANSFDASKHYEVDILNNYGAVISWANS